MKKKLPMPTIGKIYDFFDDGKESRHYYAKVLEIYEKKDFDKVPKKVLKAYKKELKEFHLVYSNDTDIIVKCDIPDYDTFPIWFVRFKDGIGLFSINVESEWQSGRLDYI